MDPHPEDKELVLNLVQTCSGDMQTSMQAMHDAIKDIQLLAEADRFMRMNTIVRTLGQPETLAQWLGCMRSYCRSDGYKEDCAALEFDEHHRRFGHFQFYLLPGKGPMTMHVWQPAPRLHIEGVHFSQEPPHTHPWNFVSTVAIGSLRMTDYRMKQQRVNADYACFEIDRSFSNLSKCEGGVSNGPAPMATEELNAGDSYLFPKEHVHSTPDDGKWTTEPAITLLVKDRAEQRSAFYMSRSDAVQFDLARTNSSLRSTGPLSHNRIVRYEAKLDSIMSYLRGWPTLDLASLESEGQQELENSGAAELNTGSTDALAILSKLAKTTKAKVGSTWRK
jgi:hypothetical protein